MHIWQYFRKNFYQMPTVFRSITVFDEKVYVFQKTFSPYFSYRHVGRSFDNPAEKNCEKHLKSSIKIPTLWKKLTIFWKTSLWNFLLNTYNAVLLTPLENLLHKTEKFILHFRRCWFFYKNILVTKHFQRTLGIQISQSRRKNFDRRSSAQ